MKVIKNYFYNAGYQLLAVILPLITAPYISRVIGAHGIGIYTATYSTIQYFILLGSIGIGMYGNREIAYVRDDKTKMTQVFWEIQILKMIMVTLAYGSFIIYLTLMPTYREYMWIQSINLVAAAFDISWLYMGLEDFKKTVLRNTLVKLTSVALIFIFIHQASDTWLYILVMAGSTLGGNLTLWPYLKKTLGKVEWKKLRPFNHFKPTVALFIPQIATQVYQILNKTMLWGMVSSDVAGFYDRSDNLVKLVLTIVTATGTVMLPHVANAFHDGNKAAVKQMTAESFDFVSFIAIPMFFGLAAVGKNLAPLFYGPEFKPVGLAVCIEAVIILLIGWSNVLGLQYLLPTNQIKIYTHSVVSGAVTNLILNLPLIYLLGLNGAILSTVLSELVVTVYQLWHVRKQLEIHQLFLNTPKYLLAGFIMFVVVLGISLKLTFANTFFMILALGCEVLVGALIYGLLILLLKPTILGKAKLILAKIRRK